MRIEAITKNPAQLQNAINKALRDNDLKTWSVKKDDTNKDFYTHTGQWEDRALIEPVVLSENMIFRINWWTGKEPDEATKGYYLGRFTEVLLVHFKNYFTHLETHP